MRFSAAFYHDLTVDTNEDGQSELVFRTKDTARKFTRAALACSRIYVADADRYAVQMLAECLRDAIACRAVTYADLYTTEPEIIDKLLRQDASRGRWLAFRQLHAMRTGDRPDDHPGWRRIPAKKRFIDPYVMHTGRISALDAAVRGELDAFLREDLTGWICSAE